MAVSAAPPRKPLGSPHMQLTPLQRSPESLAAIDARMSLSQNDNLAVKYDK